MAVRAVNAALIAVSPLVCTSPVVGAAVAGAAALM